jgi:Raf kinase inhibitor-like YbhB/YbcL family protein
MVVGRTLTMVAALLVVATPLLRSREKEVVMSLTLSSPSFSPNSEIPTVHTCDGSNKSPPLHWSGLPPGTRSLALIVDDPDAPDPANPRTTWVHWVLYDLPAASSGLPAGASTATLPKGTHEGINDWNRIGYGGPCPPVGRHRYFHKLYAVDIVLADLGRPNKAQLMKAIEGHVLAHAELIGTYERKH